MSLSDIKLIQEIDELNRNVIEDILHSNFVSFTAADNFGRLANKLHRLWNNAKYEHCKNLYSGCRLCMV